MKVQFVKRNGENLRLDLIPETTQEAIDLLVVMGALIGTDERPASIYGEPDATANGEPNLVIYAIETGPTGEALTGPNGETPRLELRVF
jgi:hypothetical protein